MVTALRSGKRSDAAARQGQGVHGIQFDAGEQLLAPTGARSIFVAGLLLVAVLQVWFSGAAPLLTRHFWIDEVFTYTVSSDSSLTHVLRAISHGVETHPPALFLLLRPFASLIRDHGEVVLRSLAFLTMLIALVGLYSVLRTGASTLISITCVVAVAAHPVVLGHLSRLSR